MSKLDESQLANYVLQSKSPERCSLKKEKKSTVIKYIGETVQHFQLVDSQDVAHIKGSGKSHSKEICLLSFQHFPNVRYFEICFSIEGVYRTDIVFSESNFWGCRNIFRALTS